MTHTTRTALTTVLVVLTDAELHDAAASARKALWQAKTDVETELFVAMVELIDAELITRARVALAAFDAAAA